MLCFTTSYYCNLGGRAISYFLPFSSPSDVPVTLSRFKNTASFHGRAAGRMEKGHFNMFDIAGDGMPIMFDNLMHVTSVGSSMICRLLDN